MPTWTNSKAVADATGFQQRTVERWAREKKIRTRRVGPNGHYQVQVDEEGWPLAAGDGAEE
jgi:hypothetical protein